MVTDYCKLFLYLTFDNKLIWFLPDILDSSAGEFEDTEEVYEAVGEVLQGISEKSEKDIRFIHIAIILHNYC